MGLTIVRGKNNAGPASEVLHREFTLHPCSFLHGKLELQSFKMLWTQGPN